MASITTWVRLEPRARDADLLPGVEARLHDPLWLLARQWQLGELDGTDAGSAVLTRTQVEVARVDAIRASGATWQALDPDRALLERVLAPARDAATARPPLDRRGRSGRQLARLLTTGGHTAAAADLLARFPLAISDDERTALDDADLRFLAVLAGRVPDGDAAAAWLRPLLAAGDLPGDLAPATDTCSAWLAWRDAFEDTVETAAWRPDHLTHAVEVRVAAATRDVHLVGVDHAGGPLHWYAFDARPGDPVDRPATTITSTNVPAGVRYRGMPARRYWELEDAAVHWPAIDAGPGDVARLLFIEFGVTFADDWLVVPIDLPGGSLARIMSLVVTDSFGVRALVRAAAELDGPEGSWHFTEVSSLGELAGPLLFLPPGGAGGIVGPIQEAIDFTRDETANVVWAIERVRRGADGLPREVVAPSDSAASPRPDAGAPVTYRAGPTMPDGWHPYVTRDTDAGPELARARVPGQATIPRPNLPTRLDVTSVSALARRSSTAFSLSRSADGSYHLLLMRSTHSIAPGQDRGLIFDRLEDR